MTTKPVSIKRPKYKKQIDRVFQISALAMSADMVTFVEIKTTEVCQGRFPFIAVLEE